MTASITSRPDGGIVIISAGNLGPGTTNPQHKWRFKHGLLHSGEELTEERFNKNKRPVEENTPGKILVDLRYKYYRNQNK